jgi:DNA-binding transcriptional ArsR family regulator
MAASSSFSFAFLESATETLRAIAHPQRLLIVEMLHQEASLTVTEIHERLGIEQAVASHHLRILKDKHVVTVRRDGKNSNYALSTPRYYEIVLLLEGAMEGM